MQAAQNDFLAELWQEALAFAGGALIRRILTTASLGVNDFNAIKDPAIRCASRSFAKAGDPMFAFVFTRQ